MKQVWLSLGLSMAAILCPGGRGTVHQPTVEVFSSTMCWLYFDSTDPNGPGVYISKDQLRLCADDVMRFGTLCAQKPGERVAPSSGVFELPAQLRETFAGVRECTNPGLETGTVTDRPVLAGISGELSGLAYRVAKLRGTRSTYIVWLTQERDATWKQILASGHLCHSLGEAFLATGTPKSWQIIWWDMTSPEIREAGTVFTGLLPEEYNAARTLVRREELAR